MWIRNKPNTDKGIVRSKNEAAQALSEGQYQPQIVKPKKGKGSYSRKGKQQDAE